MLSGQMNVYVANSWINKRKYTLSADNVYLKMHIILTLENDYYLCIYVSTYHLAKHTDFTLISCLTKNGVW